MYEIDIYLSTVSLSYEALNKTIVITGCWVFEFSILNSLLFDESLCFVPLPSKCVTEQADECKMMELLTLCNYIVYSDT